MNEKYKAMIMNARSTRISYVIRNLLGLITANYCSDHINVLYEYERIPKYPISQTRAGTY